MKFTYSSGQRVLSGYTVKRGIGRGGFGEVYYAVSDGGKEVALKLVRGQNLDVEMRGMAQCLNIKHANLLHLYDLRTDEQGNSWVLMEYVNGEPLGVVLNRHPKGLPADLARQWIVAIARAVGCLHDHGIVHRDLKPANVFVEDGAVKVGDYGLSKFMSSSQHIAQTQSVGTVHYMAPEISSGNYNKQIDIYAAGVILYEMLTGQVPFDGESAGEILMKHLTSPPDLSKVPAEFVPVVARALAKNPAQRFGSMTELAKAVEAIGAREVKPVARPQAPREPEPILNALPAVSLRGELGELAGAMALTGLFAAGAAALVEAVFKTGSLTQIGSLFFLTVLLCWAVLIPAKFWNGHKGSAWGRRIVLMVLGVLVGLGALWLDGWDPRIPLSAGVASAPRDSVVSAMFPNQGGLSSVAGHLCYFALALFAMRWWKMADPRRSQRFSFVPVFAAGFWAFVLMLVWPEPWLAGTVVLASAVVQLVSPWEPPAPRVARPVRLRYA